MCGIFGVVSKNKWNTDKNILFHRGPDDWGLVHKKCNDLWLSLFQSRLSNKTSDPYKILNVKRDDSDAEIRNQWIKLNKEHHPDNLISKGMPKEFIERANDELASINLAYEKIKDLRAIN